MKDMLILWGDETAVSGTYLLRIEVSEETAVRFGRFRGGETIHVSSGTYLYIGSAMRGLGSRLLRHASHTDPARSHAIRPTLANELRTANIPGQVPRQKRLHWHIDFLLEQPQAALIQVMVLRSHTRLEGKVANWLMGRAETAVLVPGLGASDHPGRTHLLQLTKGS